MDNIVIIKYSLFIVMSILFYILSIFRYKNAIIIKSDIFIIVLFFLIFLHSAMFSIENHHSIERSIFSLLAIIMIMSFRMFFRWRLVNVIKWGLVILGGIICITSNYILIANGMNGSFFVEGNFIGLFRNANNLGLIISVFILPVYLSLLNDKASNKIIVLLILINLLLILFLTRSRASLGAMVIVFLIYAYQRKAFSIKNFIFSVIAILAVLTIFFNSIVSFFTNKYENEASIFGTREILWEHRIYGITHYPIFGAGYQVNPAKVLYTETHTYNDLEKGNFYLALMEEFGIPLGVLLLLIVMYIVFRAAKLDLEYFYLSSTVISGFSHAMFETWILNFNGWVAIVFWIYIFHLLSHKYRDPCI